MGTNKENIVTMLEKFLIEIKSGLKDVDGVLISYKAKSDQKVTCGYLSEGVNHFDKIMLLKLTDSMVMEHILSCDNSKVKGEDEYQF